MPADLTADIPMTFWSKALYLIGLALIVLGAFMSDQVWFRYRVGRVILEVLGQPNYSLVAVGICCMAGAFLLESRSKST